MSASQDTYELMRNLERRGLTVSFADADTLRRAQLTLRGWAEQECGNSDQWKSWAIERDEATGIPYYVTYPHSENKSHRERIPDREAGALRRVAEVCARIGAHYVHQGDPRGCALYVSREPITDSDYSTRGVACCV